MRAKTLRMPLLIAFWRSSRCLGIGAASRYLRLDHDASDAIVSPKNSATIIGSRKLLLTNSVSTTKLMPLAVARSTKPPVRRFGSD